MDRYVVYLLDIRTLEGGIIFTISSYFQAQPQISWTGYILRSPSHPTPREGDMHWNWFFHYLMNYFDIFSYNFISTIIWYPLTSSNYDQQSTGQDNEVSLLLSLAQLSLSWFTSSKCTWGEGVEQILTYSLFLVHFWIVCALYLLNHC